MTSILVHYMSLDFTTLLSTDWNRYSHSSILVHSIARNIKAAVEDILFAMARLLLFPDGVIKLIYIFIDNFSLG